MKKIISEWTDQLLPWFFSHGIRILVIVGLIYLLKKIGTHFIEKVVRIAETRDKHESEDAEKKREDTLIRIFSTGFNIVLIVVGGLMILQEMTIQIAPILASAGIVGLALGFGGQYLIRDLIAGFFIIFENQYRIGDVVNFDLVGGLVVDISLRKTTLRDLDGTVHHIPHGEIKKVSNLSKEFARINLNIGVSYSADLDQVISIINQTGDELANDPNWKELIIKSPQFLRVDEFADSAIIMKVLGETQPLKQWEVTGEYRRRIKKAFEKAGIEIPFPQMVIHKQKGPE